MLDVGALSAEFLRDRGRCPYGIGFGGMAPDRKIGHIVANIVEPAFSESGDELFRFDIGSAVRCFAGCKPSVEKAEMFGNCGNETLMAR
jgi:hypothetical protein